MGVLLTILVFIVLFIIVLVCYNGKQKDNNVQYYYEQLGRFVGLHLTALEPYHRTSTFYDLIALHNKMYDRGFAHQEVMSHKDYAFGTKITDHSVYLGGIKGLPVQTLASWMSADPITQQIVFEQYRDFLINELEAYERL